MIFFRLNILALILGFQINALAIIDGADADKYESASSVFINLKKNDTVCTGVIISENLILTAAHCFDGVDKNLKSLSISNHHNGDHNLKEISLVQPVAKHQLYIEPTKSGRKKAADIQYDIAYIKTNTNLIEKFELQENQIPKVFSNTHDLFELLKNQTSGIVYGYGVTQLKSKSNDALKKELPVTVNLNNEIQVLITESLIKKRGLCQGDSGGGLFIKHNNETYLIGILSGINSKGDCGSVESYGAYSIVSNHMHWIVQ